VFKWQYHIDVSAGLLALATSFCGITGCGSVAAVQPPHVTGIVSVSGNQLLKDGALWVPHCVQLVAFVAPPAAQAPPFTGAYAHYSTAELDAIKAWGADCIRFQLSQPGADPTNTEGLYDPTFVATFVQAVKYTRSIGLNAIVSIQDESQSGETSPTALPNAITNGVWSNLTKLLNGDDGIIYEMMNEPSLTANVANWQAWQSAMNTVIQTIRASGATNTLLGDGLNTGLTLDGLIPLTDPLNEVFYSSHPYYHSAADETEPIWATRFGNAASTYPVIIGEWTTAYTYYTDSCTATVTNCTSTAALKMLQYMQANHIGLVAVSYDFGLPNYGGIVSDYVGTPTTFANGLQPGQTDYGPGTLIQNWYKTGNVPTQLE
jgi:endoglucanase